MRILCFIGLLVIALLFPFWIFIGISFFYSLFFTSYELLLLAFCIDAGFASQYYDIPYMYTFTILFLLLAMRIVKPYLRMYQ